MFCKGKEKRKLENKFDIDHNCSIHEEKDVKFREVKARHGSFKNLVGGV